MDPHGQRNAFHSSSKSQVCGGRNLITVVAEENMIATRTVTAPYLEIKEDATECSFRSFEVATATNTNDEPKILMLHLSQNAQMILRQTIGKGAKTGHGLGRNLKGIQMVISSAPKRNRYGIGYQLGDQRGDSWMGSQKGNRMVRSYSSIPPLSWTFRSGGYINSNQSREDENLATPPLTLTINIVTNEKGMDKTVCSIVHPCSSDFELNNWSIMKIPVVHQSLK